MNYHDWKIFIDTLELGSLSKAALAHGTSQPQVSRQISRLEAECGGRLFQRTGRGVVATEIAERIAPGVRAWLNRTDQLADDIRTQAGEPIGPVRLGILPSTAHPLVSGLFQQLRSDYPLIRLIVREGQGAQIESWLENGQLDLAILFRFGDAPRPGDILLDTTATYLVGAEGSPLTREQKVEFRCLDKLPLVLFSRPNGWRDRLDQLSAERGLSLNVVAEADSLGLQTHIVAQGGIYAVLGPYAIAAAKDECRLQSSRLVEPEIPRPVVLAMSPHGALTRACRKVMELIQEIAGSELNAGGV